MNTTVLPENTAVISAPPKPTIEKGWDYLADGQIAQAIEVAKGFLADQEHLAEALHLLGWAAHKDLKTEIAVGLLKQALRLDAHNARLASGYIRVLVAAKRFDEALSFSEAALVDDDLLNKAYIHSARAALFGSLGDHQNGVKEYEACLMIAPNALNEMAYMGMYLLKLGHAKRGFRYCTARAEARTPQRVQDYVMPYLKGDVSGIKVLIKRDMGIGDELSYLRYLPWLKAAGVNITYWASRKLAPVLSRTEYVDHLLSDQEPMPDASCFDVAFWVEDLPVAVSYLNAPEIAPSLSLSPRADLLDKWRSWLATKGPAPYLGINWRAGASATGVATVFSKLAKAVPISDFSKALFGVKGTFISLQRNVMMAEVKAFEKSLGAPLHDASALTDDIEDLLALLFLLDENIGVSNTNMHLRAALQLPSRVLVGENDGDWRWGSVELHSPWFPECWVYRHAKDGWNGAMQDLREDLYALYGAAYVAKITPLTTIENGLNQASKRVIWLTAGRLEELNGVKTSPLASTRYRVLLPAKALEAHGWKSEFINEATAVAMGGWCSSVPRPFDTVVISKVFDAFSLTLAKDAKDRGAQLIVDFCDDHFEHVKIGTWLKALLQLADVVVVSTDTLAGVVASYGVDLPYVISDPVEFSKRDPLFAPQETLKLLWFGHASNLDTLVSWLPKLYEFVQYRAVSLTVVSEMKNHGAELAQFSVAGLDIVYVPWSIDAMMQSLIACDIVVIPILEKDFNKNKSPNRLIEACWAGKFVVAGQLPAYMPFCDVAWVGDDLVEGIKWGLDNPLLVREKILAAQQVISDSHSQSSIALAWHAIFDSVRA